jgi:hypothetical protein
MMREQRRKHLDTLVRRDPGTGIIIRYEIGCRQRATPQAGR